MTRDGGKTGGARRSCLNARAASNGGAGHRLSRLGGGRCEVGWCGPMRADPRGQVPGVGLAGRAI
ncbi:hypothetical protein C7S13_6728 [Burkholderia cepacia]|nr:hypothetical protein [Burkholderia cepacia]